MLKDEQLHSWSLDPSLRRSRTARIGQRRAAARQPGRHLEAAAGSGDEDPEPVPGLRLRAHLHRSGHDGGRQRGGAPRGERHPRRPSIRRRRGAACGRCTSPRSSRRGASSTTSATRRGCRGTTRWCASGCRSSSWPTRRIDALESGSEEHRAREVAARAACRCRSRRSGRSPIGKRRPAALLRPPARGDDASSSRSVRLLAVRLAEAQGGRPHGDTGHAASAVAGDVALIPK